MCAVANKFFYFGLILHCLTVNIPSTNGASINSQTPKGTTASLSNQTESPLRQSRALHEITLKDPLNCLSRVVCGLHTFPPKRPTLRTSTTNDYAFLLRSVISRISKYNQKDEELLDDLKVNDFEDKDASQNKAEEEDEEEEEYSEEEEEDDEKVSRQWKPKSILSSKSRQGRRYSERSGDPSIIGSEETIDDLELTETQSYANKMMKNSVFEQFKPNVDLAKLELLRVSTDLGQKLSSPPAEQCSIHGNICPFRYDEMMKLMSGILRRQSIVSPSGDKIIPLVGYILKSRNQTTTLTATFSAIERINNLTYTADETGSPITFLHIYDEILNGMGTGNSGIRVLEDSNESASANVWEDDEFDQVLNSPYVEKKLVNHYMLKNKNKNDQPPKPVVQEESSEEEISDDPFVSIDFDSEREEDEESKEEDTKKTKFSDILSKDKKNIPPPPPAFGTIID